MMPTSSDSLAAETLCAEAAFLHQQFFGRAATPAFISTYCQAHAEIADLSAANADELRTVQRVFAKRLDACGLEPWLRHGTRRHLLSRKLMLVAYLAECDGEHSEFRRAETGRWRSWRALSQAGLKGLFRLLRGWWQKTRYGLV
jgi:hypothetical protein